MGINSDSHQGEQGGWLMASAFSDAGTFVLDINLSHFVTFHTIMRYFFHLLKFSKMMEKFFLYPVLPLAPFPQSVALK